MNIRRAEKSDLSALVSLIKPMWLDHPAHEPDILNIEYLKKVNVGKYLAGYWDNPENNLLLVAEVDGKVIGCCRAEVKKVEGMFASDRVVYVDDLVVEEANRGKGIGTALVKETEKFAKEKGIDLMQARIYGFNKAAQELFDREGYRDTYAEYYKKLASSNPCSQSSRASTRSI